MTGYKPRQESKAYCRSVWFVYEGQEEKSLLHQVTAQAAARLSGPRSADSRESLRYQNRELASGNSLRQQHQDQRSSQIW